MEIGHDPEAEVVDSGLTGETGEGVDTGHGDTAEPDDSAQDTGEEETATGRLLLTDSANSSIYVLDANGRVLDVLASPTPTPTGVAFDRRNRDGFWLVGTGDNHLYKLDMAGVVVDSRLAFGVNEVDIRGLDFWLGADGKDYLALIATNSNGIQCAATYDLVARTMVSYYSFWLAIKSDGTPDFLDGFWGAVITTYSRGSRTWELSRWASRDDGTVALWIDSVTEHRAEVVLSGLNDPKGIDISETSYVVSDGDDRVYAFDEAFLPLHDFATPGTSPADLSIIE